MTKADLTKFLTRVADAAITIAPAVVPGATPLIGGARKLIEAIDGIIETVSEDDQKVLAAARDILQRRVLARAEKTAEKLRGR